MTRASGMIARSFTLAFLLLAATASAQQLSVDVAGPAVLLATISARCDACAWDVPGREGAMLRVTLDGRYSQHVAIARTGQADYKILVGTVATGRHVVRASVDATYSARGVRAPSAIEIKITALTPILESDASYRPLSLAPFVYQRRNTIGKFTDTPLFMWYETEPTEHGVRYRYSVIFTNEDGGTPADRLMATWGRTTDIEYIYSVEVDAAGKVLSHDYQGPKHEVLPYRGQLESQHARLWVVTDNNMVEDRGTTSFRFAPAPVPFTLTNVSREVVMDANPWMYAVSSRELAREGKIVAGAPPGNGRIPDPRGYVYFEGCGNLGEAALTFAVRVGGQWISSDRGMTEYRIARDGCFRAAIPLPPGATIAAVDTVRVQAFARDGHDPHARAVFTRLNTMFMLDAAYMPGPSTAHWQGQADLTAGGPPFDISLK